MVIIKRTAYFRERSPPVSGFFYCPFTAYNRIIVVSMKRLFTNLTFQVLVAIALGVIVGLVFP